MMSEQRYVAEQVDVINEDETEVWDIVFDTVKTYAFMVRDVDTANDLCGLLNEQQSTISTLKEENEQLRQQLQDWDDMVELATKTSLRNVELDEQIGQLRKELNDCEKFRYTVFKRIGELNDE